MGRKKINDDVKLMRFIDNLETLETSAVTHVQCLDPLDNRCIGYSASSYNEHCIHYDVVFKNCSNTQCRAYELKKALSEELYDLTLEDY